MSKRNLGVDNEEPSRKKSRQRSPSCGQRNNKQMKEEAEEEEGEEMEEGVGDLSQNPDFYDNALMGTEAEVGIIERVSLKNFMCHNRLDFNFGPQVNFLIGKNGSGKSAVLTAIMVALGGKANITSRGSSLKSFIKYGKQSAEVSVRLRNRGPDAFKPNVYGQGITVERRISAEGSSTYKLRNAAGKIVSTKREELERVRDQFNIQVDNPVAVLTQETSRNFLHSKSPHDRYKFFLRATQLENMKRDYVVANDSKKEAQLILEQKKRTLPDLEAEVLVWEQRYKALSSLDSLREKVTQLKNEIAWATIHEKEKFMESVQKKLDQENARTPKFLQKIQESQEKVAAATQKKKAFSQELVDLGKRVRDLEPQQVDAKKILDQRKKNLRDSQGELRKVKKELDSLSKDRNQIIQRIEEIRSSAQMDYEAERKAREKEIKTRQEKVDALSARQRTTQHSMEQFHSYVTQLRQEQSAVKNEEAAVHSEIEGMTRQLANLRAARSNTLKRFGGWVPQLLQNIEAAFRAGKFHHKPRGPIGANIKLRDQRWALGIESCLKSHIHSFCVSDHHDEKELEKIFAMACPPGKRPTIITSPFLNYRYNVAAHKPRCRYPTVLDELVIEDPIIANCLIDQRGIESILLIERNEEARDLMSKSPPRNCKEAFTAMGDNVFSAPLYRYYSSNSDHAQYLTANVEDDIRTCSEKITQQKVRLEELHSQLKGKETEIRCNSMEERRCQNELNKIRDETSKFTLEIEDLRNVEDPAPVDIATLEEDVRSYDVNISEVEAQVAAAQDSYNQCNQDKNDAEAVFREVDRQIREVLDSGDPTKDQLARAEMELQQAKDHKRHYDDKLKEHQKVITDYTKSVEAKRAELDEDTAKAQELCERIRTRRTIQNLQSEILQIQKRITNEEKNRGNPEEITRKYKDTKDKFKTIKLEVNQLNNFLKELEKVMLRRQRQYFDFRRMIALRAKYFFIVMLSNRQYTGKMAFDHRQEVLTLSVAPNNSSGQPLEGARDMRALSGGERSFSTVCFILSLWDAMESPFRCLDEFDVFMDMVNRRMSMDMMLSVAQAQFTRQFIFLTPLDMSQLKTNSSVRIFEMRPPERGQTALPFEPASRNDAEEEEEGDGEPRRRRSKRS